MVHVEAGAPRAGGHDSPSVHVSRLRGHPRSRNRVRTKPRPSRPPGQAPLGRRRLETHKRRTFDETRARIRSEHRAPRIRCSPNGSLSAPPPDGQVGLSCRGALHLDAWPSGRRVHRPGVVGRLPSTLSLSAVHPGHLPASVLFDRGCGLAATAAGAVLALAYLIPGPPLSAAIPLSLFILTGVCIAAVADHAAEIIRSQPVFGNSAAGARA
ncbi:hypothetical protein ABH995_000956 [Bradyrhizobium yuanmingense]